MESDKYYLTDNLLIQDRQFKYISKGKEKKINGLNWHHHLEELGWIKLYKQWILKLNKISENKSKNSPFAYMDCGEEGNCLFHCIAYAKSDLSNNCIFTQGDIRRLLAENICNDTFMNVIEIYRVMSNSDDFDEDWDPNKIKTLDDFKSEIISGGNNYWGDHILIQLLCKTLKINLLILNTSLMDNICEKYNFLQEYNPDYQTIVLIYLDYNHFQIFGYYKDSMMYYLFDDKDLPDEIKIFFSL